MDEKRVRVIAAGLVQGVFFRASLRDEARRLGLSGWVRNRSDGRVEAELQGRPEAVEAGVEFIRRGPGHAEIAELEVAALRPVSGEEGFGAAVDA